MNCQFLDKKSDFLYLLLINYLCTYIISRVTLYFASVSLLSIHNFRSFPSTKQTIPFFTDAPKRIHSNSTVSLVVTNRSVDTADRNPWNEKYKILSLLFSVNCCQCGYLLCISNFSTLMIFIPSMENSSPTSMVRKPLDSINIFSADIFITIE